MHRLVLLCGAGRLRHLGFDSDTGIDRDEHADRGGAFAFRDGRAAFGLADRIAVPHAG